MLKVLITGRNTRIAEELYERLNKEDKYELVQLSANRDNFFKRVPKEMPHVIIACLGFESQRSIQTYNFLSDYISSYNATMILLAKKSDIRLFIEFCILDVSIFLPQEGYYRGLESALNKIQEEPETMYDSTDKEEHQKLETHNGTYQNTRKHVLVVEHDAEQIMQIRDILKNDFAVSTVRSGYDALSFLDNHHTDLILLDYSMPDMDGPSVLRRIRSAEKHASLPVVFLAETADRDQVIKILVEYKPQGYIIKPEIKNELISKITEILSDKSGQSDPK